VQVPGGFAAHGGNDARGANDLPDVVMVAFTIDSPSARTVRIGPTARARSIKGRGVAQYILRPLACGLGDDGPAVDIDGDEPFQPVTPVHRLAPAIAQAAHKNVLTAPGAKPVPSTANVTPGVKPSRMSTEPNDS
jgi:hypothetical protein